MSRYFDIHSHLNLSQFDADREAVYQRMRDAEVSTITVGVDLPSSKSALEFAESHEGVWACIGLHPTDAKHETFDPKVYGELAKNKKVVAVGECGLDYFRGADEEEKRRQRGAFEAQIAFAIAYDLPLMLHGRPSKGSMDAYEDMLAILGTHGGGALRGNAHFFVGSVDIAKGFFDIGFTVSFPGVITFAKDYDEVVRYAPLDRIHAETDSPYATPTSQRGKRNEPAYVLEIIAALAAKKGLKMEEVEEALKANFMALFTRKA